MNPLAKIYWKVRNTGEAFYQQHFTPGVAGCLTHRKDARDYIYGVWGMFERKPKYPSLTNVPRRWVYDQKNFNDCVLAMAGMADSYQEGLRFSIKFYVKLAKRLGYISRNGFSFLRAPLDIAVKYGRLPYSDMPDEINEPWSEYSRWNVSDELLAKAAQYKAPSYEKVPNLSSALDALENGLILRTANRWYTAMNSPLMPDFYLKVGGKYVGGHAWMAGGYRAEDSKIKDFEVLQSFGEDYGFNGGYARIKEIFQRNNFEVYIVEKIESRTDAQRFLGLYEGMSVKGSGPAIYLIENNHKRPFATWEAFKKRGFDVFYTVDDSILNQIPEGGLIE